MIKGIESITLFSESARKLAEFYKEKVGFGFSVEAEIGEKGEELFEMKVGKGESFYIVDHSDLHGKALEPKRIIINFEVDDIEKEAKRLKDAGVKVVQDIYHMENYGFIATFEDLDGNYFQLVQVRAS